MFEVYDSSVVYLELSAALEPSKDQTMRLLEKVAPAMLERTEKPVAK